MAFQRKTTSDVWPESQETEYSTERQPLQEDASKTPHTPDAQTEDQRTSVNESVTFLQAFSVVELQLQKQNQVNSQRPGFFQTRVVQQVYRVFCLDSGAADEIPQNLQMMKFDSRNPFHRDILRTCVRFLTNKDLDSLNLKKPLLYLSKGECYAAPLVNELERTGSLLSLLFILFLKDMSGSDLVTQLDRLEGEVPLLPFLNVAIPAYWKFLKKSRNVLEETVQATFRLTLSFFERWINHLPDRAERRWDDMNYLYEVIKQEPRNIT